MTNSNYSNWKKGKITEETYCELDRAHSIRMCKERDKPSGNDKKGTNTKNRRISEVRHITRENTPLSPYGTYGGSNYGL